MVTWWHAVLDRGLELLGGRAPTARDALYLLDVLAVQVLALEAEIDPAVYAAVGCLGVNGNLSVELPYSVGSHGRRQGGVKSPRIIFEGFSIFRVFGLSKRFPGRQVRP